MELPILSTPPRPGQTADDLGDLKRPTDVRSLSPLPMSMDEVRARGWDAVDVVFVTGDAYIDHPSFAMAILGRVLEAAGFRVAMVSQPNWRDCEAWKTFGPPRLFFGISAGNMDSMINHYTANRKVRNNDAYSPGGRIGLRPDRATLAYCQRAREAYKGVPVIAGGVEASLRRLAHYDYWSDKVRRSILLDCKADLVVFGMGEDSIVQIARRLSDGESVRDLRNLRGVAYAMGASEHPPEDALTLPSYRSGQQRQGGIRGSHQDHSQRDQPLQCPPTGAMARPPGHRLQSAAAAGLAAGDGPDLRPAVHAATAPDVSRADSGV